MNKAFSLIEVMVGLLIGLMCVGVLLQTTRSQVSHHLVNRQNLRAQSSLEMAGEELRAFRSMRDFEFWRSFPLNPVVAHLEESRGVDIAFHSDCPGEFDSGCLVYYDIVPCDRVAEPDIYVAVRPDLPYETSLAPADDPDEEGWGTEIGIMSVLYMNAGSWYGCFLVSGTSDGNLQLALQDQQPWINPLIDFEHIPKDTIEVTCLGHLEVTHVGLKSVSGAGHRLVYRPFILSDGSWVSKRSRSSYQNLLCLERRGASLVLFDERAREGRREVSHVTIQ